MKAKEDTQAEGQTPESQRNAFRKGTAPRLRESQLFQGFVRILERDLGALSTSKVRDPWLVGFSHGADSSALLLLLHEFVRSSAAPKAKPTLLPIHIDHGLRSGSAREALQAQAFCERLGLPCEVHRLEPAPGSGESWAREARYQIFSKRARDLNASLLFLAHHLDDDLETLLFRLMRGTGPLGLAGIPAQRPLAPSTDLPTRIYRPLLDLPKRELVDSLLQQRRTWIEDPSNAEIGHSPRNRIRHGLLADIRSHPRAWKALNALKQEALAFSNHIHEELQDLPLGPALTARPVLPLTRLQALSPWAFERYLSLALESLGQARPSRALLRQARHLLEARLPSGKCVEARGHWRLERRKKELHLRLLAP